MTKLEREIYEYATEIITKNKSVLENNEIDTIVYFKYKRINHSALVSHIDKKIKKIEYPIFINQEIIYKSFNC